VYGAEDPQLAIEALRDQARACGGR
jgi:hypothetical protein